MVFTGIHVLIHRVHKSLPTRALPYHSFQILVHAECPTLGPIPCTFEPQHTSGLRHHLSSVFLIHGPVLASLLRRHSCPVFPAHRDCNIQCPSSMHQNRGIYHITSSACSQLPCASCDIIIAIVEKTTCALAVLDHCMLHSLSYNTRPLPEPAATISTQSAATLRSSVHCSPQPAHTPSAGVVAGSPSSFPYCTARLSPAWQRAFAWGPAACTCMR